MNPDGLPPPPKPEKDPEQGRYTAISNRMQRVIVRLKRRSNLPNRMGLGSVPFVEGLSGIIVFTLADGFSSTIGEFPIRNPMARHTCSEASKNLRPKLRNGRMSWPQKAVSVLTYEVASCPEMTLETTS